MDRQTAADLLDNLIGMVEDSQKNDYDTALKMGIEALKGYTQSVRHGYWIDHTSELFPADSTVECSVCHEHESVLLAHDNYCPNCGAKMDEVK